MKFDDLIASIDGLTAEEVEAVVDWQLTESPAALQCSYRCRQKDWG